MSENSGEVVTREIKDGKAIYKDKNGEVVKVLPLTPEEEEYLKQQDKDD